MTAASPDVRGQCGVDLIAAERQRQVEDEGWTPEHDAGHEHADLARAAACYALPQMWRDMEPRGSSAPSGLPPDRGDVTYYAPRLWPWHWSYWKPTPPDRVRELVKAGALIAAEIDRLQAQALARADHGITS